MDWTTIKGISTKEGRDEVRLCKRKDGNKTVIDIEYK